MQRWKVVFTEACEGVSVGFAFLVYTSGEVPDEVCVLEWLRVEGIAEGLSPEDLVGKFTAQTKISSNGEV